MHYFFGRVGETFYPVGVDYVGVFDTYRSYMGYNKFGLEGNDVAFAYDIAAARGYDRKFVDFDADTVPMNPACWRWPI